MSVLEWAVKVFTQFVPSVENSVERGTNSIGQIWKVKLKLKLLVYGWSYKVMDKKPGFLLMQFVYAYLEENC